MGHVPSIQVGIEAFTASKHLVTVRHVLQFRLSVIGSCQILAFCKCLFHRRPLYIAPVGHSQQLFGSVVGCCPAEADIVNTFWSHFYLVGLVCGQSVYGKHVVLVGTRYGCVLNLRRAFPDLELPVCAFDRESKFAVGICSPFCYERAVLCPCRRKQYSK